MNDPVTSEDGRKANKRARYSTPPEDSSVNKSGEQSQLSVEDFLREFPGYSESMSRRLVSCPFGTGQTLMALKAAGFQMTEEDPLVHAVIDVGDGNAVAFYVNILPGYALLVL